MKNYGKMLLNFGAVALISSSISVGVYAILNDNDAKSQENYVKNFFFGLK